MTPKHYYLLLCALGFLIPYSQFVPWVAEHGLNMRLLLEELAANRISMFFSLDVVVSAITLLGFLRIERKRMELKHWWTVIAATLLVGVSLGLPLLLYLREAPAEPERVA